QHASGVKKTVEIVVWDAVAADLRPRSTPASTGRAGRPIQIVIAPGQAHDLTGADVLLANLKRGTVVIADKAYDADRLRQHLKSCGAIANIPNMIRRKRRFRWTKAIYRQR